jgi:trehalose synthase-fused probable maltokinase
MAPSARLDTEIPRLLPAFLPTQRWFAGKGHVIQNVDLDDAAWLGDAPHRRALAIVGIRYADGTADRYAMVLGFAHDCADLPVVGRVGDGAAATWMVEAASDPDGALALLRGFARLDDVPTLRGGRLHYGDSSAAGRARARTAEPRDVRPVGRDQSNSSVRVGGALVFKLFRKLETGENPELELGRFLTTRTTFRAMPTLHGSLSYVSPRGEWSTLALLQDWIDSRADGWTSVVDRLGQPAAGVAGASLAPDMHLLGVITADLHAALGADTKDPAFAPEPATAADVEAWRASLQARATRVFSLVERHVHRWTGDARRLGEALLDLRRGEAVVAEVSPPVASPGFHKIRIHGDYHLGQTLKTADGFALVDFEGEPGRPVAERRLKHCALKDVAGMLRSFDYAVEAARGANAADDLTATRRLREPFLEGYLTAAVGRGAVFLPSGRPAIESWVAFFEIEKALYEVEYELDNRPARVATPLRGSLRLLGTRPSPGG